VPNEEVVDRYVRGLYQVVVQNSALLFAATAAERFGTDQVDQAGVLTKEVRRLAALVAAEARERGIEHVDLEMAVTCTTALVLAMGLGYRPRPRTRPGLTGRHRSQDEDCQRDPVAGPALRVADRADQGL
jgi:hypothetical protein